MFPDIGISHPGGPYTAASVPPADARSPMNRRPRFARPPPVGCPQHAGDIGAAPVTMCKSDLRRRNDARRADSARSAPVRTSGDSG